MSGEFVQPVELLELDIDTRLVHLLPFIEDVDEWDLETVLAFMRAAYGAGYVAALSECVEGQLVHDHGYRMPARREC